MYGVLLILAAVGNPWARPNPCWQPCYVQACQPVTVAVPCGTVIWEPVCCETVVRVVESGGTTSAQEEITAVVAEEKVDEAVTENAVAEESTEEEDDNLENVAAEESDLINAAFGAGTTSLGLDHMALDWGVAQTGLGTLYPTPGISSPLGGGGGFGNPFGNGFGSGNDDGSTYYPGVNTSDPFIIIENDPIIQNIVNVINNNCNTGSHDGGNQVPEPMSMIIWALGLGLGARRLWSRRKQSVQAMNV